MLDFVSFFFFQTSVEKVKYSVAVFKCFNSDMLDTCCTCDLSVIFLFSSLSFFFLLFFPKSLKGLYSMIKLY